VGHKKIVRKFRFTFAFLVLVCCLRVSAQESCFEINNDPLFNKMEGAWIGKGTRIYLASKNKVEIQIEVETQKNRANGIFSKNNIEEFIIEDNQRKTLKSYLYSYWIKCKERGHYVLGKGDSFKEEKSNSKGIFQNDVFNTTEYIGGDATKVLGETRFISTDHVEFSQKFYFDNKLQSITEIKFYKEKDL